MLRSSTSMATLNLARYGEKLYEQARIGHGNFGDEFDTKRRISMDWSYAVVLALAIAAVKAVEGELEAWGVTLHPRIWLYAKALVTFGAVLLMYFVQEPVPEVALVVMSAVAGFLAVLGYWPEVQEVGLRLKGREERPLSATWRQ